MLQSGEQETPLPNPKIENGSPVDEIQYLEALHERITIQCGDTKISTKNGVHQAQFQQYVDIEP